MMTAMRRGRRRTSLLLALAFVSLWAAAVVPVLAAEWDEEIVEEHAFDIGEGGTLDIDVADADVDVRAASGNRVEVVVKLRSRDLEWARSLLRRADLRVEGDDDRVRIRSSPVRTGSVGKGWQLLVVARIPERFDLSIETGDGDVRVERVVGEVQLTTGDGDLFLGRAEGEELNIETGDGDIVAKELSYSTVDIESGDGDLQIAVLRTDRAKIETSDGDIGVAELSGPLRARSGDGDIAVGLLEAAEVSLGTGDGNILIKAPAGLALNLQLSGEEVVLEAPGDTFEGRTTESSIKGDLNGGGPRLSAISGDGDVRLILRGRR